MFDNSYLTECAEHSIPTKYVLCITNYQEFDSTLIKVHWKPIAMNSRFFK